MSTPDHITDPIEAGAELLSSQEVAELFNVTIWTIKNWKKKGYLLPQAKTPDGRNRYSRKEVARLLAEHAADDPARRIDTAEAVRLYKQGWSIRRVAEKFDVSYDVMRRLLREHTTLRGRGGHPTHTVDAAEAVRLYEQGWSIRRVAEKFDVSYKVMRRLLREHTTLRGRGRYPTHTVDIADAVWLYEQGCSIPELAEKFDTSYRVMNRLLRKHTTSQG